ncbi:hypothetical protein EDC96DRAFT_550686, partial [Choanephora cucurbitarum]
KATFHKLFKRDEDSDKYSVTYKEIIKELKKSFGQPQAPYEARMRSFLEMREGPRESPEVYHNRFLITVEETSIKNETLIHSRSLSELMADIQDHCQAVAVSKPEHVLGCAQGFHAVYIAPHLSETKEPVKMNPWSVKDLIRSELDRVKPQETKESYESFKGNYKGKRQNVANPAVHQPYYPRPPQYNYGSRQYNPSRFVPYGNQYYPQANQAPPVNQNSQADKQDTDPVVQAHMLNTMATEDSGNVYDHNFPQTRTYAYPEHYPYVQANP